MPSAGMHLVLFISVHLQYMADERDDINGGWMATGEPGDWVRRIAGVHVFQWNPLRQAPGAPALAPINNFGDLLGPIIVERMLARQLPEAAPAPDARGRQLFTAGSVMHFARSGAVVWGSGINGKGLKDSTLSFGGLDVRAVRGPWTAQYLYDRGIRVPRIFGDPALLLPRLLPELDNWRRVKRHDVLLVPNFHDYSDFGEEVPRLDPTLPVAHVLRSIAQSRFVIGSSLHAIAVADALSIPARLLASPHENLFKYRDYLSGTGRPVARIATSVDQALDLGGHGSPDVDLDLLEASFPWDLWHDALGRVAKERARADAFEVDSVVLADWKSSIFQPGEETYDRLRRRFFDELVPEAISAASEAGANEPIPKLERAAEYRRQVLPWLHLSSLDERDRELVQCIERRDAGRLAVCAKLHDQPISAKIRMCRLLRDGALLSVSVTMSSIQNHLQGLNLLLESTSSSQSVVVPSPFFSLQNQQWLLELDIFVAYDKLSDNVRWRVSVELVGTDGVVQPITSQDGYILDIQGRG